MKNKFTQLGTILHKCFQHVNSINAFIYKFCNIFVVFQSHYSFVSNIHKSHDCRFLRYVPITYLTVDMTWRQCKKNAQDEHNSWSAEQATAWTHYSKLLRMIKAIHTKDHAKLPAKMKILNANTNANAKIICDHSRMIKWTWQSCQSLPGLKSMYP